VDVLVAIDALDDLLWNARSVPLSDEKRIDREALAGAIERIRASLAAGAADPRHARAVVMVDRLDDLARMAPTVPLSSNVRVDPDRFYEILDRLRKAMAEDSEPGLVRSGVEAVRDVLLPGGGEARKPRQVRVQPRLLSDALAELRAGVEAELTGFEHSRALQVVDRLEALAAAGKPRRLLGGVQLDLAPILTALDELPTGATER
jgi:hypothetical protein